MKEQLLSTLETSKTYTLAVATVMPEKHYKTKITKDNLNFGELIDHITYGIRWWEDNFIKGKKTDWNPPATHNNKDLTISDLTKAYDGLKETISKKTLSDEGVHGFHSTLDHITHHRGQAVLYLRSQGIVPPEYTY